MILFDSLFPNEEAKTEQEKLNKEADKADELVTINCTVTKIIYRNNRDGFTVLLCWNLDSNKALTVTGTLPVELDKKISYKFTGHLVKHEKYGKQLALMYYEQNLPVSLDGIREFLSSSFIKGIGKSIAKRIVALFGEKTFDVIDKEPERLMEVNGIGKGKYEKIVTSWAEQREIKNILAFLKDNAITDNLALKIYHKFGINSVRSITENPFCLCDIEGIGFKRADEIAMRLEFPKDSIYRIEAALLSVLKDSNKNGDCFLHYDYLIGEARTLLGIDEDKIVMTLDSLDVPNHEGIRSVVLMKPTEEEKADDSLALDTYPVYLAPYYYAELGVARHLARIKQQSNHILTYRNLWDETKFNTEEITYADEQIEAIRTALTEKIMILTGGPGTGKTTTVNGIIQQYNTFGGTVLLAAPTGRAAKRLSSLTNREAKTIHRLLEYNPDKGFQRNDENRLDGDVLIVDESSMIDIILMNSLLKAVPSHMSLIFVGDSDQLPSVGAGNVLHDLINSNQIPVVCLKKIFRQAEQSRIITTAHAVNAGQMPVLFNRKDSDFFFLDLNNEIAKRKLPANIDKKEVYPQIAMEMVVDLIETRLPKAGYKQEDIQLLTPQKGTLAGTNNLNPILQAGLNPCPIFLKMGRTEYRLGDRVMQIQNNYDKEVFNGDVGVIVDVNTEDKNLTVLFDQREVKYEIEELDDLVLAYASTIHKAQGCEYPIVVMPLIRNFWNMLHRNLLYTGITRAKDLLIIVGTKDALYRAVTNNSIIHRNTMLTERLIELLGDEEENEEVVENVAVENVVNDNNSSTF